MSNRKIKVCILSILATADILTGCSAVKSSEADIQTTEKIKAVSSESFDLNATSAVIAIETGTTTETAAKTAYPQAKFIIVDDAIDGFLTVTSKKADAFAVDKTTFESYLAGGNEGLRVYGNTTVGEPGNVAVAISPATKVSDAEAKINDFLTEMSENGTLNEMRNRWLVAHDYTMPKIAAAENPAFTITVGTTGLVEPYSFYEGTDLTGYDLELMKRFANWCNAKLAVEVYDWDGITPACASGKVDYIMSNLFETPEKREVMGFSIPYTYVETVMVVADEERSAKRDGFLAELAASFEKTFLRENRWQLIWDGLLVTLEITIAAGIIGTLLGFLLCLWLRCRKKPLALLAKAICHLMEGIPSLVVLMIIYFVIFASVKIAPVTVGIIAFSLIFAVAVAGILNTGIGTIDAGQWEAASALGFARGRAFTRIIMPQAVRKVLPIYRVEFISMLKLTSIVGYISIVDLTKAGDIIRSRTYEAFFPLIATAVIYFGISAAAAFFIGRTEKLLDVKRKPRRYPQGVDTTADMRQEQGAASDSEAKELIRVEHLQKDYDNVTPLKDVNTVIRSGEVITVIGPSGTGKSTFLRCLNRLETPTSGKVIILGEDLDKKETDLCQIRRQMGMVFQNFNLFPHLSVIENIMLAPTLLKGETKQDAFTYGMYLLKTVGMAERALAYPDELSGGQKQRVAIARALAMRPQIVLFDEPTSALDPTMVGEVLTVIRRLAKEGLTMLIVTHEMKFARDVSTRVFYMDEGEIYEEGTPKLIFDEPKREKTRAFVKRLKVLRFQITSPDYDFIAMSESLQQFGERHFLSLRQTEHLRRAFEEICALNIVPNRDEENILEVFTEYYEADGTLSMRFVWGGRQYHPLEAGEEISVRLAKSVITGSSYTYEDEKNQLVVWL